MKILKKGNRKRILALSLAAVMVVGLVPNLGLVQAAEEYVPMTKAPEVDYRVVNAEDLKKEKVPVFDAANRIPDGIAHIFTPANSTSRYTTLYGQGNTYQYIFRGRNIIWSDKYKMVNDVEAPYDLLAQNPDLYQTEYTNHDENRFDNVEAEWYFSSKKALGSDVGFGGDARDIYWIRNILFVDDTAPGYKAGKSAHDWKKLTVDDKEDSNPIIWLYEGEALRPTNKTITYEELAELKLKVAVVPKSTPSADYIYVTAEAVKLSEDGMQIGFRILENDWKMLCEKEFTKPDGSIEHGTEYQIVSVTDASSLSKTYSVWRYFEKYDWYNWTDKPVTDLAGNPLEMPKNWNVRAFDQVLDAATPSLYQVLISGTSIVDSKSNPNAWPADLDWGQLFTATGEMVQASLVLDEIIQQSYDDIKNSVSLVWSIKDKDGNPITSKLSAVDNEYRISNQGDKVTRLVFEPITITEDMGPSGTKIQPKLIKGANLITDANENKLSETSELNLLNVMVDNQTYLDNEGPIVKKGDTIKMIVDDTKDIRFTTEFTISDGDGLVVSGIKLVDTQTPNGKLEIQNKKTDSKFEYKYMFSQNFIFPEEAEMNSSLGAKSDQNLFMTEGGKWYLHVLIPNKEEYEVLHSDGLDMQFSLRDYLGNESSTKVSYDGFDLDNVKPNLEVTGLSPVIERVNTNENKVTFTANVTASDLNGLTAFQYKWDDTAWEVYDLKKDDTSLETTFKRTYSGTESISHKFYVKVTDKKSDGTPNEKNWIEKEFTFTADLGLTSPNYTLTGNVNIPSSTSNVNIGKATYSGELQSGEDIYTRVTLKQGDKTFVRIFKASEQSETEVPLFGDTAPVWYEVTISDDKYNTVLSDTTPDWTYYGKMTVSVESSLVDLTPVVGNVLSAQDGLDTQTRSEVSSVDVLYAPKTADLYDVGYVNAGFNVKHVLGESNNTCTYNSTAKAYVFKQTMDGHNYEFYLSNEKNPQWVDLDRNFENSYMVLLKLDNNGNIVYENGQAVEVTERMRLAPYSNVHPFKFPLPYSDKNGKKLTTGAYQLRVYVEQKDNPNGQTFDLEKFVLDASPAPSRVGIFSYESTVNADQSVMNAVSDGTGEVPDFLTTVYEAAEGDYLRYITIGAADASWTKNGWDENNEQEVVTVDGNPLYVYGNVNSLHGTNMVNKTQPNNTPVKEKLTFSVDFSNTNYSEKWLGIDVGKPASIRIWNAATENGKANAYPIYNFDDINNGVFEKELELCLNNYLNTGEYASNILSEEELKVADHSHTLYVKEGENTICYEVVMENGVVSPEKQFILNIEKKAPEVKMEFDLGTKWYRNDTVYDAESDEYVEVLTTYTDEMYATITELTSYAGGAEVYYYCASGLDVYDEEKDEWVEIYKDGYNKIENPAEPILLNNRCASDGYQGFWGTDYDGYNGTQVRDFFCIVDDSGNATLIYPITDSDTTDLLYEKCNDMDNNYPTILSNTNLTNPDDSTLFSVNVTEPDSENGDGVSYKASIKVGMRYWEFSELVDSFTFQIGRVEDGQNEVVYGEAVTIYSDAKDKRNDFSGSNSAGIVEYIQNEYEPNEWGQIESAEEMVFFVPQYDPNIPEYDPAKPDEGLVNYRVKIVGTGSTQIKGETPPVYEIVSEVFSVKNTKPDITLAGNGHSFGDVKLDSNTYVALTDRETEAHKLTGHSFAAYSNGTYEVSYEDKYGTVYTKEVAMNVFGDEPKITISNTELTCKPVTVTAETTNGALLKVDESLLPEGTAVTGNNSTKLEIVLKENAEFNIMYGEGTTAQTTHLVSITNINTTPIDAKAVWTPGLSVPDAYEFISDNGTPDDLSDDEYTYVFYDQINVILADANGSKLLDSATGTTPEFTFTVNGETSHTFSGYTNQYGMEGEDVTVELPENVVIKTRPVPIEIEDTFKPDISMGTYKNYNGSVTAAGLAYKSIDANRPEELMLNVTSYMDEDHTHKDMDELLKELGWAQGLTFRMDVKDENDVKLILSTDIYAVPKYESAESEVIEGVSLIGRQLEITKNCRFVLHAVDSKNNVNTILFNVTNVGGDAPEPNYVQMLTKEGDVRVYLLPPNLEHVTDLKITSSDKEVEDDTESRFYNRDYMSYTFDVDTSVDIPWSYRIGGQDPVYSGVIKTTIQAIDGSVPKAEETWSANYDKTGKKGTNTDITLQLEFDKLLKKLIFVDENGAEITPPQQVKISWIGNKATIIFTDNTPTDLRLKATALINGRENNEIIIPKITTIDRSVPLIQKAEFKYSDTHKEAYVTIITNEDTILQRDGSYGTEHLFIVYENGEHEFVVADRGGNTAKVTLDIKDIVTEDLKITVGTGTEDNVTVIDDVTNYPVSVGEVLFVKVNRASSVSLNRGEEKQVAADTWLPMTIEKDMIGYHPTIKAVDEYGNTAGVQFEKVPMKDMNPPVIFVNKDVVFATMDMTKAEIDQILMGNMVYGDDVTPTNNLDVDFVYTLAPGKISVVYKVTDAAGNVGEKSIWMRVSNGQEPVIRINGEQIECDSTIIVPKGTLSINVEFSGEPYKVEWKAGIKKSAQMKIGSTQLTSYTEETNKTMTIDLTESGYYTFLLTTQGRTEIRFMVLVEK